MIPSRVLWCVVVDHILLMFPRVRIVPCKSLVHLEHMEIMLIIVKVKYLADEVPIAQVLFQIDDPLLENEILIEPPSIYNQTHGQSISLIGMTVGFLSGAKC